MDLVNQRHPQGSFASVSAGYLHTCGVREDGFVACWGSNEDYERNYGGQATPPEGRFVSVNTLGIRTCGVREDGSVTCWGDDSHGAATPPAGRFASVSVRGEPHVRGKGRRHRRLLGFQ